ncbi:MAG: hypothetical protein K9L82_18130 [Chromatiaceae bacterium]|nr:hypothetical protein [Chromatiaceae bacterium]
MLAQRKWDEQNRLNHQLLDELRQTRIQQEPGVGAVGACWGLACEANFYFDIKDRLNLIAEAPARAAQGLVQCGGLATDQTEAEPVPVRRETPLLGGA